MARRSLFFVAEGLYTSSDLEPFGQNPIAILFNSQQRIFTKRNIAPLL